MIWGPDPTFAARWTCYTLLALSTAFVLVTVVTLSFLFWWPLFVTAKTYWGW